MSSQRHASAPRNSTSDIPELLTADAPESSMDTEYAEGRSSPIAASTQYKGKQRDISDATSFPLLGSSRTDSQMPSHADMLAEITGWRRQLEEVTAHLEDANVSDSEVDDSDENATPPPSTAQPRREYSAFRPPTIVASFQPLARPQGPNHPQSLARTTTNTPAPSSPTFHPIIPWHTRRPRGCTTPLANYVTMDPGFTPDAFHRSLSPSCVSSEGLSRNYPRATIRARAAWATAAPDLHGLAPTAHTPSFVNGTSDLRTDFLNARASPPHQAHVISVQPVTINNGREPSIRIGALPTSRLTSSQVPPHGPTSHTTNSPTLQDSGLEAVLNQLSTDVRELRTELVDMRQTIQQAPHSNSSSRPGRHKKSGTKDERPRDPQRNLMMHTVRTSMNGMIGIRVDEQITQDGVAAHLIVDPELLQQLEDGTLEEVPLKPLMVDWDNPRSEWNVRLSEVFAKALIVPDGCEWSQGNIAGHFLQRIETLASLLRKHLPNSADEDRDVLAAQLKARKDITMKIKRSRKRQATRAKTRADIAIAGSQGGRNAPWTALLKLVQTLKIDGHSSDETDDESGGLLVHTPGWRHPYVSDLLRFIDNNKNTKNEYGNSIGGAQPLIRHRNKRPILSRRPYMPHLPNNLYDPGWLHTLSNYTREHDVQPQDDALPLPRLLSPEISPGSHVVI